MVAFKIFTASSYKSANETFNRLAEEVTAFVATCEGQTKVEWLQSAQGDYDARLTAIVTYYPIMEAYS